jgi:choline dehydrogenase-like flavoprotein
MPDREYDVVVVGGSLAGCAAARLPALRGARVAVVDAPNLDSARPIAKWFGKLEMSSTIRPAAARGMVFVGDAVQASDPLFGVGCGWAFESADWLDE